MVALGFIAGLWTASRRAPISGISGEKILDLGPWLLIGTLVGARLLYVITFWRDQFAGQPLTEWLKIWQGGLVFYGGLIGASLAYIAFARLRKLPLWVGADVLAPSIALGQVLGRVGCLLFGCCYGKVCHLPWAIRFPAEHPTHPVNGQAVPVHPTQIYESILCLGLYAGLAWLYRRKKFDGQIFAAFLVGYAAIRFFVELFRGDYPADQLFLGGALTPAHIASLLIFAIGVVLFFVLSARRARPQA
jgi:phosphatidylglycerol:prolipoprotein diacylglycerol transferase